MTLRRACVGALAVLLAVGAHADDPRSGAWPHRMRITFPGYTRATPLTNFPALVVFGEQAQPGFRYGQMASSSGADLRFTDGSQTSWLNFEIEAWAPGSNSYVWVQIPVLSGTGTVIYALSGNPSATNPPACTTNGATWAPAYDGVWHCRQPASKDSCAHANHLTAYDGPLGVAGPVDRGVYFSGVNRLQGSGAFYEYPGRTTVEFWMRSDAAANNRQAVGIRGGSTRWSLHQVGGLGGLGLWNNSDWITLALPGALAAGRWYHVVWADSGADRTGTTDVYVNGALAGTLARSFAKTVGQPLVVGTAGTGYGSEAWVGGVDEVRIAPRGFSADWIWATWRNQASNQAFVASQPMLSNLGATNLTAGSADLTGYLYWTSSAPTAVWLFWGGNDGGTVKTNWDHAVALGPRGVGPLSVLVTFASDATYAYRFYASNAVNEVWAGPAAEFVGGAVTVEATEAGDFIVRRPAAAGGADLTVFYTVGGTAVSGVDHQPLSGSVLIPAGADSALIRVVPIETLAAVRKTVVVTLVPGGYLLGAPSEATAFLAVPTPADWRYRRRIVFAGYTRPATLTNFPALVTFDAEEDGFEYAQFASPAGGDLRFTDGAQSRWLHYDIDEWKTNGVSSVWVQVPALVGTNTSVWACWGNAQATTPSALLPRGAAWSQSYTAVFHFNEGQGAATTDATPAAVAGTLVSGPAWTAGAVGGGLSFDGVDDYVATTKTAADLGCFARTPRSGEAWVYVRQRKWGGIWSMGRIDRDGREFSLLTNGSADQPGWQMRVRGTDGNFNLVFDGLHTLGNWVHVAVTAEGGTNRPMRAYINGELAGFNNPEDVNTSDDSPLHLGRRFTEAGTTLDGIIDEVRLSSVVRSPDWIWASARQRRGSGFATYGGLQSDTLLVRNVFATDISGTGATLNGSLVTNGGAATRVWLCWGAADARRARGGWEHEIDLGERGIGPLSATVALPSDGFYHYRLFASNALAEAWSAPSAGFLTGALTLEATQPEASEEGAIEGEFTVYRPAGMATGPLTVNYTVGGTAQAGVDYVALPGWVRIAAGQTSAVIAVTPIRRLPIGALVKTVAVTLAPGGYRVGAPDSALVRLISSHPLRWAHSLRITFKGYTRAATLADFPALVILNESRPGFRYRECASPRGADLRFSDDRQTLWLPYEIDEWNTNGNSYVWVRVPALAGPGTSILAHWGNPEAVEPPDCARDGSTWSQGYLLVYHFNDPNFEDATLVDDATAGRHSGRVWNSHARLAGRIGWSVRFPGGDLGRRVDTCKQPSNLGLGGSAPRSCEAWVRVYSWNNRGGVFSMGRSATAQEFSLRVNLATDQWRAQMWGTPDFDFATSGASAQWVHLALVSEGGAGSVQRAYVNGNEAAFKAGALDTQDGNSLKVGVWRDKTTSYYLDADMDELRLSRVARSADWVWASAASQGAHETFVSYALLQPQAGALLILR